MRCWDLPSIDAPEGTRDPVVINEDDGARGVLMVLNPGQKLEDHQVKENTWAVVVEGTVTVSSLEDRDVRHVQQGGLIHWDAHERHSLTSVEGARVLLLFTPWPGAGHYTEAEAARP